MKHNNKINPKINLNMQKIHIYNGVIITFFILFIYFMFSNNISMVAVTNYLFHSDLGRIVLIVTLIAIASCNLLLGILLLGLLIFLYEYQRQQKRQRQYQDTNISKYNNMSNTIDPDQNNKNITIEDIISLENNISSKQSNSSMSFVNSFNTNTKPNSSKIMQINPSFEGTFNQNYAPFLQ
jgi:hypothetical protein|uniref:Uncharacterized protein n=1 Tax=viral metagenome TaxID=1070528 RepID=A0A6C0E5P6_9ZZZZ